MAIGWLLELFGLPPSLGRRAHDGRDDGELHRARGRAALVGERHGVDVDERGFAGLPAVPVFSSGYIHPSATKALAMLGIGRGTVRVLARDAAGGSTSRRSSSALPGSTARPRS